MGQVIVSNLFSWRAFFVPKESLMGKFLHDGRMSPKPHLLRTGEGGRPCDAISGIGIVGD